MTNWYEEGQSPTTTELDREIEVAHAARPERELDVSDMELSAEEMAELKAIADASPVEVEAFEVPPEMPPWYECEGNFGKKHQQVGPGAFTLTNFHDKTTVKIERSCTQCIALLIKRQCGTKVMKKQPKAKKAE